MDLFEMFGGMNVTEDTLVEAPKRVPAKKKADNSSKAGKTSGGKSRVAKKNKAVEVKFTYPVTVVGRNFKTELTGEGEVDLQNVAETLYNTCGYLEVAHERVRFVKLSDNLLMLDYSALRKSGSSVIVTLPVSLADGLTINRIEQEEGTEDEETTVEMIAENGLPENRYKGVAYDYDPSSGIALPVFASEDATKVSFAAGDTVYSFGNREAVKDPTEVVEQMLGELPEHVSPICLKESGEAILYYQASKGMESLSVDRKAFGVDTAKKEKIAEEKISLPVVVNFVNFSRKYLVEKKDMEGKDTVTWEELFTYLKGIERLFAQTDRKTDHLYDKSTDTVSVAMFSGSKGCNPCYCTENGFSMVKKIPGEILTDIVNYFAQDLSQEAIVQIWFDEGRYYVVYPHTQNCSKISVRYEFPLNSAGVYVMAIHSHNTMPPIPSVVDDKDELQLPGLYGIIGLIEEDDEGISFQSFFRVTSLDKEPIVVSEAEIFEEMEE